jgi:hypothetical protein
MRRQKKAPSLRLVDSDAVAGDDSMVVAMDRDCVLEYPAIDPGYTTLVSVDENGRRYEEMRTPLERVQDAIECMLERVRDRPRKPLILY